MSARRASRKGGLSEGGKDNALDIQEGNEEEEDEGKGDDVVVD